MIVTLTEQEIERALAYYMRQHDVPRPQMKMHWRAKSAGALLTEAELERAIATYIGSKTMRQPTELTVRIHWKAKTAEVQVRKLPQPDYPTLTDAVR